MKFKVNDKVRILSKHDGMLNEGSVRWKKGDVAYISDINSPTNIWLKKTIDGKEENGFFYEEDLELVKDFKVGDTVRILDKTFKIDINTDLENSPFKRGDIAKVSSVKENYLCITRNYLYYHFSFSDVELVSESEISYKFIKDFSYFNFLEDVKNKKCNATFEEIDSFKTTLDDLGYSVFDSIEMNKEFHDYFTQHDCFVEYLIRCSYIEKAKIFKPFTLNIKIDSFQELEDLYNELGKLFKCSNTYMQVAEVYDTYKKIGG